MAVQSITFQVKTEIITNTNKPKPSLILGKK